MTLDSRPYPLFLMLRGRRVLVVGGGVVAHEKAQTLHAAGARIHVVAPNVRPDLASLAETLDTRAFAPCDVDDAWLVVSAATPEVNRAAKRAADERRVFTVAVDDVASCSAIGAAHLERGGLTVAISSTGRAPALVALLRRALAAVIPDDIGAWVTIAEQSRTAWKAGGVPFVDRRPLLLRTLNEMYAAATLPPTSAQAQGRT